jgi:hypothetical protein
LAAVASLLVLPAVPARGDVLEIVGSATTTIVQSQGGSEVQRDSSQEIVPETTPFPPAVARAQLDHLQSDGLVTAAGQAVAILYAPNLSGLGPPNDVGFDLAAFSDDTVTSWNITGVVSEKRTIILRPAELGAGTLAGDLVTARSQVVLSGVMLITSLGTNNDLSGAEVHLRIRIDLLTADQHSLTVLDGEVVLSGGPDGAAAISQASGAFAGVPLRVDDFLDFPGDPAVVRAIFFGDLFGPLHLPYEYEVVAGQPFDLALSVECRLQVAPDKIGASAVFGLPQDGLASVFGRVKREDVGHQIAAVVSEHVDTTGQAYQRETRPSPWLFPFVFPLCGAAGLEMSGLMVLGGWLVLGPRRSRRRPRRPSIGR